MYVQVQKKSNFFCLTANFAPPISGPVLAQCPQFPRTQQIFEKLLWKESIVKTASFFIHRRVNVLTFKAIAPVLYSYVILEPILLLLCHPILYQQLAQSNLNLALVNIISQTIMTFLCTFQLKTDSAGRMIFIKQKELKFIPFNKNLFQSNSLRSRILQIGVSLSHLSLEVL